MPRVLNLVLAAWIGSLWTVCGLVAPAMFSLLADRHVAGQVAAYFFRIEAWLGVAFGAVAWFLLRRVVSVTRADYFLLGIAALAPLTSELVLVPMMSAARAAGDMSRFGMLHGLSALLFGSACISGALLLWRVSTSSNRVTG